MRCYAIMPQSRKSSPYLHWMWDSALHAITLRRTAPKLVGHIYFYIVSTYHVFDWDGRRGNIQDSWDQMKWHVARLFAVVCQSRRVPKLGFLSFLVYFLLFFLDCLPFWYCDSEASTTGNHTILIKLRRSYMATSRNRHGRFGGPGWCSGSQILSQRRIGKWYNDNVSCLYFRYVCAKR